MSVGATLEDEYRKNKELKEEEFQRLKDWYALQAHLPPADDALLSHLFHSCWFRMEPAKVTADNYFTMRTHATDLFSNRDPMTVNLRNESPVVLLHDWKGSTSSVFQATTYLHLLPNSPDQEFGHESFVLRESLYNLNLTKPNTLCTFDIELMTSLLSLIPNGRTLSLLRTFLTPEPIPGVTQDLEKLIHKADGKTGHYFFLNKRTPENYRVCLVKPKNTDPSAFVFSESSKSFLMHHDLELHLNGSASGDIIVFDMEGISLGHLARLNLSSAKNLLSYMQDAMPVRLINVHFINVVPFMDKIMALLRPFMSKEFVEKLKFHTEKIHTLFEFVPQKIMPRDYGGEDKSVSQLSAERLQLIQKWKKWFEQEEKIRVDESKRIGKTKLENDFGIQGSFKKLDID